MKEEKWEEVDAKILEPLELRFSDLLLLSSHKSSSCSEEEELKRLESISRAVMETLGPSGPGLLSITGVPKASYLRKSLLPLAPKLALMDNQDRRHILQEHNLGSDVSLKNPNRNVSSFALQLKYAQNMSSDLSSGASVQNGEDSTGKHLATDGFHELMDNEFRNLGNNFKELGVCMMELGLQLARVCDRALGGCELEQTILDSCTAKGRLIHYHSDRDNLILKEAGRKKRSSKKLASNQFILHHEPLESQFHKMDEQASVENSNEETCGNEAKSCRTSLSNLWQQWHYDYGIFTVLTTPMFISPCHRTNTKYGLCSSCEIEHPPPDGHTYLQIFDPKKNGIFLVRSPPDSFIVQVGESADILSKRSLSSTLHSVYKPLHLQNLSRETFVVFLQPAWNKTFSFSECHEGDSVSSEHCSRPYSSTSISSHSHDQQLSKISVKINGVIPPLCSRMKDGMTFAEFSRETTKQYYGSKGMQSEK